MKISYNWLKDYIKLTDKPEKVAEILTAIGLEVEGIEKYETIKGGLEGIVIGKVVSKRKHSNADKLSVTEVDTGSGELLNIVCGAPNVEAGQKVVVATIGTTLYSGEESFTIKKAKIRGELSEGMICAEDEIGLGTSHDGIMVLEPTAQIGTPAKKYFNIEEDYVFEIGLTPNRIDSASHYGVARDLAAYYKQHQEIKLTRPSVDKFQTDDTSLSIPVLVENTEACLRYSGVTISGVEIKESPDWLKHKLTAIGLKPINNVVDITNFILHETGQPLHAFDAAMIKGNKVVVRTMPSKTKFRTLDDMERELHADDLMICNTEEGMCMAGVFGGIDSGVSNATKNIFLESANFNPVFVRKTAKRHSLSTDSSFRFERGADPEITVYALKRAAILIKEIAGGRITSEVVDVYPDPVEMKEVKVGYSNISRLIGKELSNETIRNILKSLEFVVSDENSDGLTLKVPTYRVDVTREADVIEEILRIYGYNNVEIPLKVNSSITYMEKPDKEDVRNTISNYLSGNGFFELWSNSITRSAYYREDGENSSVNSVQLLNPLSSDLNCMRQNLLHGGLEAILHNQNRKNTDLKLYEFGNCYKLTGKSSEKWEDRYMETEYMALFVTGKKGVNTWDSSTEATSFFEAKTFVSNVLKRLGYSLAELDEKEHTSDTISEGIVITRGELVIGAIGKVSPALLAKMEIEQDVFYGELNMTLIFKELKKHKTLFKELPKYPSVKRDLALLLDKSVKYSQLRELAFQTERRLLKKVGLFDVYEGKGIEEGKKSYALSYILQDEGKTLTDKQIEKTMNQLVQVYEKELGAKLR